MKNLPFPQRFRFACQGLRAAWRSEKSFRTHVVLGTGALILLSVLRPSPIWWAVICLVIGAVLAAELLNTALEHVIDRLHPEAHPLMAVAKDCAAAAVLVLSFAALAILACLLVARFAS